MKRYLLYMLVCFMMLPGVSMARDPDFSKDGIEDLPRGKWWRMPEVAGELKISSDEQAKLDDLYYKHRNRMIDLKGELKKEQIALEWFIEKEKLDEAACNDQFQKVLEAQNKLSTDRYHFLIEVRKILGYERFLKLGPKFHELRREKPRKDFGRKEPRR